MNEDMLHAILIPEASWFQIPYSRYYKPGLYLFFSPFGAASIQEFVHFPSFSTVELHFGAASIQEGLIFESGL